ncbi:OmpH family outer membrane protein [Marinilabiliaceae bacterium JC017]|nr:OmpH family outer membrane protein [Marinilabiliaceae bacterium JC017]
MKNFSNVLSGISLVAVVVLFVMHFAGKGDGEGAEGNPAKSKDGEIFPLAYINTDSLLLKYEYAKVLNEKILGKEEQSRADFNEKAKVFQQDAMEFQRKVQNNGFLSLDRAKKEEERLGKAQRKLQELEARLSRELMAEHDKINKELRDTLISYLEGYAETRPYKVIMSNTLGDNVLYSKPGVDVTNEVVGALNDRFKDSQEK